MNEKELIGKIDSSMYHQIQTRGYAAPVDVLEGLAAFMRREGYENIAALKAAFQGE
jgi:hypothetical protein